MPKRDGEGEGAQGASIAHDGGLYPGAGESGGAGGHALAAAGRVGGARAHLQADRGERELLLAGKGCLSLCGAAEPSADCSRECGGL